MTAVTLSRMFCEVLINHLRRLRFHVCAVRPNESMTGDYTGFHVCAVYTPLPKKFQSVEAGEETTLITAEPLTKMFGFLVALKRNLFMSLEYSLEIPALASLLFSTWMPSRKIQLRHKSLSKSGQRTRTVQPLGQKN